MTIQDIWCICGHEVTSGGHPTQKIMQNDFLSPEIKNSKVGHFSSRFVRFSLRKSIQPSILLKIRDSFLGDIGKNPSSTTESNSEHSHRARVSQNDRNDALDSFYEYCNPYGEYFFCELTF